MSEIKIPNECILILTQEGFIKRYAYHLNTSKTYIEAYEKAEEEVYYYFKVRKYSGYNVFTSILSKRKKVSRL